MLGRSAGVSSQGPNWWRWSAGGLCVILAVVLTNLLTSRGDGPFTVPPQVGLGFNVFELASVGLAIRAWRHPDLDRRSRQAWGVMGVAFVLLSVSGALFAVFPSGVGFPSPADAFRLAFVPVVLVGLLMLPLRVQDDQERYKVWLDTIVMVVTSSILLWYLEIGPTVVTAGDIPGNALAAAIAYPALDLILIFGCSVVLFRGAARSARRPAALLALAMFLIVAGDVYLGYRQGHDRAATADRWPYACWLTGHFTLAMAALEQCRLASRDRIHAAETQARSISILPYLAVGLSLLLLVFSVRDQSILVLGMVTGAVIITSAVLARQIVALKQNHLLAITDALTGLVNRRHLHDRLRLALTRSARSGQSVAALLVDMTGFKQINDTMGHEAGDQLLIAVGQILRRNVLGLDIVGRLGGDEFVVVLHNIESLDNAAAVARRIIADLRQPVMIRDMPIVPRAAIGMAASAPGELTADELLGHADQAMYHAKRRNATDFASYVAPPPADVTPAVVTPAVGTPADVTPAVGTPVVTPATSAAFDAPR